MMVLLDNECSLSGRTIITHRDTQPLLAVKNSFKLFALLCGGNARNLGVDSSACANVPPGETFTT